MIRINLLPWREARRKAQRQHLGVVGGMVAVLGFLIVGAFVSLPLVGMPRSGAPRLRQGTSKRRHKSSNRAYLLRLLST